MAEVNIQSLLDGVPQSDGPVLHEGGTDQGQTSWVSDLRTSLQWLRSWTEDVKKARPVTQYQYIRAPFNSNANADTDIVHTLSVTDPNNVDFTVVGVECASAPATPPVIYIDTSATRRAWGKNYIVLRSTLGGIWVHLLLTVRPTP